MEIITSVYKTRSRNESRSVYKKHYGKIPSGYHVHHLDCNPSNNCITNLIAIPKSVHSVLHRTFSNEEMKNHIKEQIEIIRIYQNHADLIKRKHEQKLREFEHKRKYGLFWCSIKKMEVPFNDLHNYSIGSEEMWYTSYFYCLNDCEEYNDHYTAPYTYFNG